MMLRATRFCLITLCVLVVGSVALDRSVAAAAQWNAGTARVEITPAEPVFLAGYAARNHPAEGAVHPLWAKALALADQEGNRVVIVTIDLIGITPQVADAVFSLVGSRTGLKREHILFNVSHTHAGPVVLGCADVAHRMNEEETAAAERFRQQLIGKLAQVIEQACGRTEPARLYFGQGEAPVAVNRRKPQEGRVLLAPHAEGPVERHVPVLVVKGAEERLQAVLFGYACHNTTLGGDFYQYCGDYAGFAQAELEAAHPGTQAMFVIGCGADANPHPRGTLEHAQQHGRTLAEAVDRVLAGDLQPVEGRLAVAMETVDLPLVDPPPKAEIEAWSRSDNEFRRRLAAKLLAELGEQGELRTAYPCPIHVVQFGNDLTVVAIGGEVVVDYALRLRRELGLPRLWIAGYSNDVFSYVPSERVLAEGGYEPDFSMMYFGFHGPYKPGLEQAIVDTVKKLVAQCCQQAVAK